MAGNKITQAKTGISYIHSYILYILLAIVLYLDTYIPMTTLYTLQWSRNHGSKEGMGPHQGSLPLLQLLNIYIMYVDYRKLLKRF